MEEEKKGSDNFPMQFFKNNTTRHPLECLTPKKLLDASKCKPDTKVSEIVSKKLFTSNLLYCIMMIINGLSLFCPKITIITTLDMETEKEHCFQPLMPGFSI